MSRDCRVLAEMLARDGHRVDTAPNGAGALERVAAQPYDLIITDGGMPVLTGIEFYQEFARRDPPLAQRVIFITGDALNTRATEFLERLEVPRVSKPFTLDAVQAVVRRMLR